jgi:protein TonB
LNRWILPVALSFAVHLNVLFLLPEASFPTPGKPAILKAHLVTLRSGSVRPPEPARPPAERTPAPKGPALPKVAKDSPLAEKGSRETEGAPAGPAIQDPTGETPGSGQRENPKMPSGEIAPERATESPAPRGATGSDILSRKSPLYPLASRRKGESGTVVILVNLDGQGQVLEASIRSSSGYPALDRSAMAAVGKWKFRPGAPPLLLVPVIFRLE